MKSLKQKIFLVLFLIFSLINVIGAVYINFSEYAGLQDSMEKLLMQLKNGSSQYYKELDEDHRANGRVENGFIFSELPVAFIRIDTGGTISAYVSEEDEFTQSGLEKICKQIVNSTTPGTVYIGNLYTSNYAFDYIDPYSINIVKTGPLRNELLRTLQESILFLFAGLIIAGMAAFFITRWAVRPAEEAFEKQKQFIADTSHELKTPLAVIMASADMMETDPNIKWVHNIQSEGSRMSRLITSMLELTRTERSDQLVFERQNLSLLVEKALLPYESIIFEKHLNLDYDIEEDIFADCDEHQIKQITGILIDNAISHSYENSTIRVALKKNRTSAVMSVENNGNPIKKGDEERIFERFYRADDARNRKDNHYGLGLAIAKNIIEAHGGTISAASSGSTTVFTVTLPLQRKA